MPFPRNFRDWVKKKKLSASNALVDELLDDDYQIVFWFCSEDTGRLSSPDGLKFESFVNDMVTWLYEQDFDGWMLYKDVDHEVVSFSYEIFLKDDPEILAFHLAWYGNYNQDLFPLKNIVAAQ